MNLTQTKHSVLIVCNSDSLSRYDASMHLSRHWMQPDIKCTTWCCQERLAVIHCFYSWLYNMCLEGEPSDTCEPVTGQVLVNHKTISLKVSGVDREVISSPPLLGISFTIKLRENFSLDRNSCKWVNLQKLLYEISERFLYRKYRQGSGTLTCPVLLGSLFSLTIVRSYQWVPLYTAAPLYNLLCR